MLNIKKNKKEEVVIFGIGKLGTEIIRILANLDKYFIIAIDENEDAIQEIKEIADVALIGDATEEEFLDVAGINNAAIFIIAIGDDIESSILLTSLLLDKFDGRVIVRSEDRIHRNILKKLGVNTIINPNTDSARKISLELSFPKFNSNLNDLEVLNFDESVSFVKTKVPEKFLNKQVKTLQIPKNILIAIYVRDEVSKVVDGEVIFKKDDEIYFLGDSKKIYRMLEDFESNTIT